MTITAYPVDLHLTWSLAFNIGMHAAFCESKRLHIDTKRKEFGRFLSRFLVCDFIYGICERFSLRAKRHWRF
jgi:hypothetical protein